MQKEAMTKDHMVKITRYSYRSAQIVGRIEEGELSERIRDLDDKLVMVMQSILATVVGCDPDNHTVYKIEFFRWQDGKAVPVTLALFFHDGVCHVGTGVEEVKW